MKKQIITGIAAAFLSLATLQAQNQTGNSNQGSMHQGTDTLSQKAGIETGTASGSMHQGTDSVSTPSAVNGTTVRSGSNSKTSPQSSGTHDSGSVNVDKNSSAGHGGTTKSKAKISK